LWDDGLSTQQEGKSDVRGWGATQLPSITFQTDSLARV
jgi:hypothetical protein